MELIGRTACALVEDLANGDLSPHDLLDALETRIAAVDGPVNALPTLCFDRARANADALLNRDAAERGVLCGLPVAIKDLADVAGVRSTQGSMIYEHHVPEESALVAQRVERSGGLIYAKSNTPEFGAGANTFNDVFGATRNPWNLSCSAAGSSGGSAAALATGSAWLAHGSDMGGSLRNPASFCGIVGLRPSPGRVPAGPGSFQTDTLPVEGPMARTVEDVALFLDALSGADPRDPLSLPGPSTGFLEQARQRRKPLKVAFSRDLGVTPVDPEVADVAERAARAFEGMGVVVEEAHPDLSAAHEVFQTLRAHSFATGLEPLLKDHREKLKPEIVWNVRKGLALTSADIAAAHQQQSQMMRNAADFMADYDLLLTPATIVPPGPVENRYVEECAGVRFETYIDWLAIAFAITCVSLPALSLPAGFTASGLPVGLQMVGRHRGEGALLAGALLLEEAIGPSPVPIDPRPAP